VILQDWDFKFLKYFSTHPFENYRTNIIDDRYDELACSLKCSFVFTSLDVHACIAYLPTGCRLLSTMPIGALLPKGLNKLSCLQNCNCHRPKEKV